jgi:hypothetical protein
MLSDEDVLAAVTDDAADMRVIHGMSIAELKAYMHKHNVAWLEAWQAAAATTRNLSQKLWLRKLVLDLHDRSLGRAPRVAEPQAAHMMHDPALAAQVTHEAMKDIPMSASPTPIQGARAARRRLRRHGGLQMVPRAQPGEQMVNSGNKRSHDGSPRVAEPHVAQLMHESTPAAQRPQTTQITQDIPTSPSLAPLQMVPRAQTGVPMVHQAQPLVPAPRAYAPAQAHAHLQMSQEVLLWPPLQGHYETWGLQMPSAMGYVPPSWSLQHPSAMPIGATVLVPLTECATVAPLPPRAPTPWACFSSMLPGP